MKVFRVMASSLAVFLRAGEVVVPINTNDIDPDRQNEQGNAPHVRFCGTS